MKRPELQRVTDGYISQLKKHSRQIPGVFALEDIHALRVSYKKMRAFLHLLRAGTGKLHIPTSLKQLYRAAGAVRDGQLFLQRMETLANQHQITLPVFLQHIQRRLFTDKEQLVQAVEQMDFKPVEKDITRLLPRTLQEEDIHRFVRVKMAAIRLILLAGEEDQALHAVRKHLKDIVYNNKTFQALSLPVATSKKDQLLHETADRLGVFNDHCNTVALLQADHITGLPPEEKTVLEQWRENWLLQKDQQLPVLWKEVCILIPPPSPSAYSASP
jgi:CHAD domain-containing protein